MKRYLAMCLTLALVAGLALSTRADAVKDFVDAKRITFTGATADYVTMPDGKPQELVLKWTNPTKPGTLHIDAGLKVQAEVLVVGGGGAGGTTISSGAAGAGGGGAGGLILYENQEQVELQPTDFTIIVGRGGKAALSNGENGTGENGQPSVFSNLVSAVYYADGGGGGGANSNGNDGGSGGGGSQGYVGGKANDLGAGNDGGENKVAASKGGAGGGGAEGVGIAGKTAGGGGGSGRKTDISGEFGSETAYAGGGGGGIANSYATYGGAGGSDVGGNGGTSAADGEDGVANTGSGGGGGGKGTLGGNGADGIVIIRLVAVYDTQVKCPTSVTKDWTGYEQTGVDTTSIAYTVTEGTTAATGTGAYTYKVKPTGEFVWSDTGDAAERSVTWYIVPIKLERPTVAQTKIDFDGLEHSAGVAPNVGYVCEPQSETNGVHARTYSFTVKLNNPSNATNYVWKGESARLDELKPEQLEPISLSWEIVPKAVKRPTVQTELMYNGFNQVAVVLDPELRIVEGGKTNATNVAADGKPYTFTVLLNNPEGMTDYVWDNGEEAPSVEPYEVSWAITQATNAVTELKITGWRTGAKANEPKATAIWEEYSNPIRFRYASSPDAGADEWKLTPPSAAGTWYVKAYVEETANYAGAERIEKFIVWDNPTELFTDHVEIAVKGYKGAETLRNFPLAIRLSEAAFPGFTYEAAGDGSQLAFILGDLMLDYDVEMWDPKGESLLWVKVPELTSTTKFELWWNLRPGQATTGPKADEVWSDYVGVWHMGEAISSTAAGTTPSADSTGHGLDAVPNKGTNGTVSRMISTPGVLGNARIIDSQAKTWGNHLVVPDYDSFALGGQFVFSTWAKFDDYSDIPVLVSRKARSASGAGWAIEHLKTDRTQLNVRGSESQAFAVGVFPSAPKSITTYTLLTFVYDGPTVSVYANGELKQRGTITAAADNGRELYLGGGYAVEEKNYSLYGKLDETRLRKGTLSTDWIAAEYQSATETAFTTNALVVHNGLKVNYWTEKPDVQPRSIDLTDADAHFAVTRMGRFADGSAVAVRYYAATNPDEPLSSLDDFTTAGTYYAVFTLADGTGYMPIEERIELRVYSHTPATAIGGTDGDSGRVLLMNRDANKECPVNYQGYADTSVKQSTYWVYLDADVPTSTAMQLQNGANSVLYRKDGSRLWHLKNCRHGNTFPASAAAELNSTQNYLPWQSTTAYKFNNSWSKLSSRSDAGRIVMQNVVGASVYSSCFEDGIGTIYFDAVNGWTSGASETGENYKLRIEYAVSTDVSEDEAPTDVNSGDYASEDSTDWYSNLASSWRPVPSVTLFKRDGTADFVEETVGTNIFALAIQHGGTDQNFYRVAVTLNETRPVRFRIVRETYDSSLLIDQSALIVLDNIIVSIPPIWAELKPTGRYDAENADKRGVTLLGQELATTVPFPAVGARDVHGRANPILHETALMDVKGKDGLLPDSRNFISSAKMHYRWRYLNQVVGGWKEVDLSPMANFVASTPLEIPEREGDVEFWFESVLMTPYYEYVDYSGTGLGIPMSEEVKVYTNSLNAARVPVGDLALPTGGEDWFFRLRRGVSASEGFRVIAETAESNAYGRVNLEIVGDHLWRGFLATTNAVADGLRFRIEETVPADPASTGFALVTNCWQTAANVAEIPASLSCEAGATNAWKTLVCDASTGYLQFLLDDSSAVRTLTVSHADRQDFNRWHDAHKDPKHFVGNSTQDDKKSGVSSKMRDYPEDPSTVFSTWTDTPATDPVWGESFVNDAGNFTGWDGYAVFTKFPSAATPNGWSAGPGMWINQQWQYASRTGAYQMEGQGKGYLEYPKMSRDPRGLESVSYRARLAQEIQFGDISYRDADGKLSMTNYAFGVSAVMSDRGWAGESGVDDFDGAGQISVVTCYRPMIGCYEFRVTRTAERRLSVELFKWTSKNGVMKAASLSGGPQIVDAFSNSENTPYRKWRNSTSANYRYPFLYISVETEPDGAKKIQAGYSRDRAELGDKLPTGNYMSLCYRDAQNPLKGGTYGIASANCDARFALPRTFKTSVTWLGGDDKNTIVRKLQDAVTFGAEVGREKEKSAITGDLWALCDGRMSVLNDMEGIARWGLKADVVPQEVVFEYRADAGSANWIPLWTNKVSGFTLSAAQEPKPKFYRTANGTYRLRHNGTMDDTRTDVVLDEVELRQWGGDSFGSDDTSAYDGDDDVLGWRDRFVFTSGWVRGHKVELNAKRTTVGKPCSIRSPLMDGQGGRGLGLGMVSFTYENVDANANLLVQIATNNVQGTAIDETRSLEGWTTVTNFPASVLGKSGTKTVFLGLHGVKGLLRIALDPKTVEAAQKSTNSDYGRVDISEIYCRDEPVLDLTSWWGWNLRTMGADNLSKWDDGSRTYLPDFSYVAGGQGLSLALNNSMDDTVKTELDYYKQHMPFVQTPTFVSNIVGEVTFRARMFGADAKAQKAEIRLYGATMGDPNIPDEAWKELAHFVVSNTYYETYHYRAANEAYRAFRLGVAGVPEVKEEVRGESPTEGMRPVRVMIDEVIVSEAVYPRLGFRYVYPVRTFLSENTVSPAYDKATELPLRDEQPLVGENWTVQAEIMVKQLPDEIDLTTPGHEPRVFFHWFEADEPWGFEQWRKLTGDQRLHTAELAKSEDNGMVFRGSLSKAPAAIADEASADGAVVQYTAAVVYYDKKGDVHTNELGKTEWKRPQWYDPRDLNAGKIHFSAFSIFETIAPGRAWINEVNVYDGITSDYYAYPADGNQYVEIAVPAGQSLKGWRLDYINNDMNKTNTLCVFGEDVGTASGEKRANETNEYVFVVVQSPSTQAAMTWDNVTRPDGTKVVIDGTWSDFDGNGGRLEQNYPIALRLVRPSQIVEQEIAFEGCNSWKGTAWSDAFSLEKFVLGMNTGSLSHCYAVGDESDDDVANVAETPLKGLSLGVFRGTGLTSNDWNNVMHQTPGWCNEGQTVPEGFVILPNGAMIVVTARLDGSGAIRQTFGEDVETLETVRATAFKGGTGTNIVYFVDTWYESAGVTTNGVPVADAELLPMTRLPDGRTMFTFNVGRGCSNNITVVASARPWSDLETKYGLDPNDPYTPAVMDWLRKGKNYFGESFENPGEIHVADFVDLGGSVVTNLSLKDMYWLDMDPTESNWWFQAGVAEAPTPVAKPVVSTFSITPPGEEWPAVESHDENVELKLTMCMTNTRTHASYAPYILRGVTPGSNSHDHYYAGQSAGQWGAATFKITGDIQNGKPMRQRWLPLRWFYFLPDESKANRSKSFDENNQAVIQVWDPFDPGRSGLKTGWEIYRDQSVPVFYSWAIDTRNQPTTVEPLMPDSTF